MPLASHYSAAFAAVNDAVLITDQHGVVVDANPAAERMFGEARAAMVGRTPEDIVGGPGSAQRALDIQEALRRGDRYLADIPYTRKDGSTIIKETTVIGIRNAEGALIGTVGFCRDVTTVRRIGAIAQAEQRWRRTLDYAPIGIALVGLDGRWLRVNDALCRIVGYREDELIGRSFVEITPRDEIGDALSLGERLLSGEISQYRVQRRFVHARGHLVPVSVSVAVVRDDAGDPLHLVCQVEDVTERQATVERLEVLANQDPVTELANRSKFLQQLDNVDGDYPDRPFAVGFVDLDGFKEVNDHYGHSAGDQLLRIAGQRIRSALRPCELAARFGGDEFAVLLVPVREQAAVERVAGRLVAALGAPYHLDVGTVRISASIGIAIGSAGEGGRALLGRADAAMYRSKAGGRNTYTIG